MKSRYPKDEIQKTIEEIARQHIAAGMMANYSSGLGEYLLDNEDLFGEWVDLARKLEKNDSLNEKDDKRKTEIEEQLISGLFEAAIEILDFVRDMNDDLIGDVLEQE